MKKDIGFWNEQGEYIPDIQELNEIERKEIMETKNFNEFFDELNDMANFKGFGEKKETECEYCEDCSFCKGCFKLQQENAELKAENERLKEENEKLLHQKNTMSARYAITYTTLQEIKEIVYEVCKICQDNVTSHCEQCSYNKILSKCNKITKVEEE